MLRRLDLRNILRLHLVDAEADHQVGHHRRASRFRLADDADGLVDVEQDPLQAFQQMQLFLLLAAS